ncbi:MAG TPA: transglutaminase-like domain-containing protein [Thermoanaerobaculia bacterium]|nr:transglutaminase-like domain-containing protein [Thermoanaerobaculia bacterium]
MNRLSAAAAAAAFAATASAVAVPRAAAAPGGTAVYFARGRDASLFDQFDVDGYSLQAFPERSGVRLVVKASGSRPASRAPRAAELAGPAPAPSAERDRVAGELAGGKRLQRDAVRAILDWIRTSIVYDPDRGLPQDPAAVFVSRRAYCVGFAELAVDLLRRAGIPAATVQGVLVTEASAPGYSPELSGVYHRWVQVFYPDTGWTFEDPLATRGGIDARYVAFARRSWTRPGDLRLDVLSAEPR